MDIQGQDPYATPYSPSSNGGGPTGIPDPNRPGYDTGGFPLQGQQAPFVNTAPNAGPQLNVTPTGDLYGPDGKLIGARPGIAGDYVPGPTDNPAPPPPGPGPAPAPPGGGALANYSVPPPAFPSEPSFTPTQFTPPSVSDALADPGYQFEEGQSLDALQRWAAAKGTLNDTGTATALMDVGRNAATQRLGDVWNRDFTAWQGNNNAAAQAYGMNRQSQYIDPWTAQYNAWAQQGNWYLQNQGTVAGTALGFAQL